MPMRNADRISSMPAGIIPRAYGIDYTDVDEVCGYQLLLCKLFEKAGGFLYPPVTNSEIREIQGEGRIWLREVRDLIASLLEAPVNPAAHDGDRMTLDAIPGLLSSYDFFYRVCNGEPCPGYLREIRLRTADRWLRGDRSISTTDVVIMLLKEVAYDIRTLEKRYTDYSVGVMGKWIDELTRYGRFRDIPLREAYSRLRYLIQDNLFAYLGSRQQDGIKRRWVETYSVPNARVTRIGMIDAFDTKTLYEYIGFIRTASGRGYCENPDDDSKYACLWAEYASRPDVHPFHRKAIEIDLESRSNRPA